MSQHNIEALREHLFKTLEALTDEKNPMEVARAKAIADVAQTIINSAMVEVRHAQLTGAPGSKFLDKEQELPKGITGSHVHKCN